MKRQEDESRIHSAWQTAETHRQTCWEASHAVAVKALEEEGDFPATVIAMLPEGKHTHIGAVLMNSIETRTI